MKFGLTLAGSVFAFNALFGIAQSQEYCQKFGPQSPRDISSKAGTNPQAFPLAAASTKMNLCNIHYHLNAEHKGPGFSTFAGKGEHGGYKCNETSKLTAAELKAPVGGACKDLKPGDTIEVHWVYSSCDVVPGKGLGSCSSPQCGNPTLRVETQVFLIANNKSALNFGDFDYAGAPAQSLHQTKSLPAKTGTPVVFRGSTTGPSYTEEKCSPLQVTWSVRPMCAKIDVSSVHKWCEKNAFEEDHGHGVRELVKVPALLDKIM